MLNGVRFHQWLHAEPGGQKGRGKPVTGSRSVLSSLFTTDNEKTANGNFARLNKAITTGVGNVWMVNLTTRRSHRNIFSVIKTSSKLRRVEKVLDHIFTQA
jgi:hypothetical protein